MPSLSLQISPSGPIVEIMVGVSSARLGVTRAAGLADPPLVAARMLVDTGASNTNLCESVLSQLGISPTGQVQVHTPSTGTVPVLMDQFDVNFYLHLPHASGTQVNMHIIPTIPVICADFQSQGIHGLIGRDILSNATLIYQGYTQSFTLSF